MLTLPRPDPRYNLTNEAQTRTIIERAFARAVLRNQLSPDAVGFLDQQDRAGMRDALGLGTAALEDYEAGTWTPSFTFATPGDLSVTYAVRQGVYWKMGRTVGASISIDWTPTFTSASGESRITGLPFVGSQPGQQGAMIFQRIRPFPAGATMITLDSAGNYFRQLYAGDNVGGYISAQHFVSGQSHYWRGSITYVVNG